MPRRWLLLLALATASCGEPTVPAGPAPVTLHARNLLLAPGESLTLGLDASASGFEVRADFEPMDARLELCPLVTDGATTDCLLDLAWGVRTPVDGRDVDALRFRVLDQAVTLDLVIEYFERSREVEATLPRIPPAPSDRLCVDNACNPLFELTPVEGGTFEAEARFDGDGEIAVLSGRILARSQTATGVPYRVAGRAEAGEPLTVPLSAGSEYAVVVRQEPGPQARGLRDVVLTMIWP